MDAKAKFEADLSKDSRKVETVRSSTSLVDVQTALIKVKAKYDSDRKDSKLRWWLVKLSERVHFYGGVLDVFAQHHPEYVALAWGSIKFLVMVIIARALKN